MKGSDRQAAKTWAINITIQGIRRSRCEVWSRDATPCSNSQNLRSRFDRLGTSRLDVGRIYSRQFKVQHVYEKLHDTMTYGVRVRASFLFLFTNSSGVFPCRVHYPRPKYEQDHGTSTPGWRYIFGIIASSPASQILYIRLFQTARYENRKNPRYLIPGA